MFRRYGNHLDDIDKQTKEAALVLQQLLLEMDAVVCTRAIPKFKARLVRMVKESGKVVLAIGDGANDVHMLTVDINMTQGSFCWCRALWRRRHASSSSWRLCDL